MQTKKIKTVGAVVAMLRSGELEFRDQWYSYGIIRYIKPKEGGLGLIWSSMRRSIPCLDGRSCMIEILGKTAEYSEKYKAFTSEGFIVPTWLLEE